MHGSVIYVNTQASVKNPALLRYQPDRKYAWIDWKDTLYTLSKAHLFT